ncbi:hypothetical protein A0J61_10869, partial [Choanephora cucurbitarum]
MPNIHQALSLYVQGNKEASLEDFFLTNLSCFAEHEFESLEVMRRKMKSGFVNAYKKYHPDTEVPEANHSTSFWANMFSYNKKTPEAIRTLMFKWYFALNEGRNEDFYAQNKEQVDDFLSTETSHPRILLDQMSVTMLKQFGQLKCNEL